MLSVLIPIYNYDVTNLVTNIYEQLIQSNIPFEIIALEDGSDLEFIEFNKNLEAFPHTKYLINESNLGRTYTRQMLSKCAQYNWLLFLDSDTLPKTQCFIKDYLPYLNSNKDSVFGGVTYKKNIPNQEFILRWKYGVQCETKSVSKRCKTPYKNVVSANVLIKKSVFQRINNSATSNYYGYDNYFGSALKKYNYNISHIDNPVYHLGLEPNNIYLEKLKEAVRTLLYLNKTKKIEEHENNLLWLFNTLKKYHLNKSVSYFYTKFCRKMECNLLSAKPSIKLLQLYKISYLCYIDLNS